MNSPSGIMIDYKDTHFTIEQSGADIGKLQLKYPILSIDVNTLEKDANNQLKANLKLNGGITSMTAWQWVEGLVMNSLKKTRITFILSLNSFQECVFTMMLKVGKTNNS